MKITDKYRFGEVAISIGMAIVALIFYTLANFKQTINELDPGPALFPHMISIFLLLLCAGQLAVSFSKKSALESKENAKGETNRRVYLYVLGTLILSIIYIISFESFNYLITTTIYILALMLLLGIRKWQVLLSVAILYSVISYYLFGQILMVSLP